MSISRSVYKTWFAIIVCSTLSITSFAQSNPLDKKLDKAKEMVQQDKLDKAGKYLCELLDKNPEYGDGWDLLMNVCYKQYDQSKLSDNIFNGNFTITVKDEQGKVTDGKSDSLASQLSAMLKKMSPSKIAYNKFTYTLRKATLLSRDAYMCSAYLRILNIDVNVDSNVSKKALKYFNEGETEFGNKNYGKAAQLYKHATEEQPDFYKAHMYMGDCFYFTQNYTDAIISFKEAKEKFPYLLEPRKYLVDAYAKANLYDKSIEEAALSTTIYPDFSIFQKMEDAAYLDHKQINIKWTARGVFPNTYKDTSHKDINEYVDNDYPMEAEGPWKFYKDAAGKIAQYSDANGVLLPNPLTKSKYAEVYAWEEMLKNSNDPVLEEARKMQKQNYLDCYVLISCFHYDLYNQYFDFVATNKDRVVEYYKTFTKYR